MAIKINVSKMMGIHKMNMSQLAYLAGIDPRTVSRLYYGEIKRIELAHINALCKTLKCSVGEIFEYVED